jgi:hypothetical protein
MGSSAPAACTGRAGRPQVIFGDFAIPLTAPGGTADAPWPMAGAVCSRLARNRASALRKRRQVRKAADRTQTMLDSRPLGLAHNIQVEDRAELSVILLDLGDQLLDGRGVCAGALKGSVNSRRASMSRWRLDPPARRRPRLANPPRGKCRGLLSHLSN